MFAPTICHLGCIAEQPLYMRRFAFQCTKQYNCSKLKQIVQLSRRSRQLIETAKSTTTVVLSYQDLQSMQE
jgi:U3 small nucleolar RNA-associated protein 14